MTVGSGLKLFYPVVVAIDVMLFLVFLAFVLLFALLPKDKAPTAELQCLLGERNEWPPRRIVSAAYKGFLAVVCIMVASLFAWFGRRIYSWLKKVEDLTGGARSGGILVCGASLHDSPPLFLLTFRFSSQNIIAPSQRILVITIYNIVSLIVTAVLLVVSNVVSWRNNYFACIISWFFDLIPLLLLLWVITRREDDSSSEEKAKKAKAFNPDAFEVTEDVAPSVGPALGGKMKSWDGDSSSDSNKVRRLH